MVIIVIYLSPSSLPCSLISLPLSIIILTKCSLYLFTHTYTYWNMSCWFCCCCLIAKSCLTLQELQELQGLSPARILCPWNFPGKNTGVGCHFLLPGIFPTQGLNPCLLHCRQILYHLRHQGSLLYREMLSNLPFTFKNIKPPSKGLMPAFPVASRTVVFSAPNPVAGHCWPVPLPETPGHPQASLAQSLVGSLLLSPGSWCAQACVCAI